MKRYYPVIVALLGVLVGVLLVLSIGSVSKVRKKKVSSNDWRKIQLVLDYVNANYVDTIDYKEVTEAAVKAALSRLDPHSVYMPPTELKEAETDLAGQFE